MTKYFAKTEDRCEGLVKTNKTIEPIKRTAVIASKTASRLSPEEKLMAYLFSSLSAQIITVAWVEQITLYDE